MRVVSSSPQDSLLRTSSSGLDSRDKPFFAAVPHPRSEKNAARPLPPIGTGGEFPVYGDSFRSCILLRHQFIGIRHQRRKEVHL